jgi:hypothetical protein
MKAKELFLNLDIIRTHRITFNNEETICQQNATTHARFSSKLLAESYPQI